MNPRALALAACLALGGLVAPAPAHATSLVELSFDQLVVSAELIVRGTVQEVWTERDANGRVWTRTQLELTEVLKGEVSKDTIIVDQLGGTWAGRTAQVYGGARFDVGEETMVFLEQLDSGHTVVVGLEQGKYTLKMDPVSREQVVFRTPISPALAYDHRFVPLPKADQRVTITDFNANIFDAAERGWDGEPIPGISEQELLRRNVAATKGVK